MFDLCGCMLYMVRIEDCRALKRCEGMLILRLYSVCKLPYNLLLQNMRQIRAAFAILRLRRLKDIYQSNMHHRYESVSRNIAINLLTVSNVYIPFRNVFIQLIYVVALICWGMLCFSACVYLHIKWRLDQQTSHSKNILTLKETQR